MTLKRNIPLDAIISELVLLTLREIAPLYREKGEKEEKMDERQAEGRAQTMKETRIRSPTKKKPLQEGLLNETVDQSMVTASPDKDSLPYSSLKEKEVIHDTFKK